jgi:hypothetical protein
MKPQRQVQLQRKNDSYEKEIETQEASTQSLYLAPAMREKKQGETYIPLPEAKPASTAFLSNR